MSEEIRKYLHNLTNKFMASDSKLKLAAKTDSIEQLREDVNKVLEINKEAMSILKDLKDFADKN